MGGITWPHLVPISSHKAPEPVASLEPPSAEALWAQFEDAEKTRPLLPSEVNQIPTIISPLSELDEVDEVDRTRSRRSTEGDQSPAVIPVRLKSQLIRAILITTKLSLTSQTPARSGTENFQDLKHLLPLDSSLTMKAPFSTNKVSPEARGIELNEDIGLLSSPIALAGDSAADTVDIDNLSSLLDDQLALSRYQFGSTMSLNTSMQPLIQSMPDAPIGGKAAEPMKRSHNTIGTRAIQTSCENIEPPMTKISTLKNNLPNYGNKITETLRSQSNFSDPCYDTASTGHISRPLSPMSIDQYNKTTAPKSAVLPSHDGPSSIGGAGIAFKDFGKKHRSEDEGEQDADNEEDACPVSECKANRNKKENMSTLDKKKSPTQPKDTKLASFMDTDPTEIPSLDGIGQTDLHSPPVPSVPGAPEVPNEMPDELPNTPEIADDVADNIPGIPSDITGNLAEPEPSDMSKKERAKRVMKRKTQKTIRKARKTVLTKQVLRVMLGGTLSEPTANALKLIAEGVNIVPTEALPVSPPI